MNEFEHDGVKYVARETATGKAPCSGCAFNGEWCRRPNPKAHCTGLSRGDGRYIIWVRADEPRRVERLGDPAPEQNTKPTNPKDAIGIRKAPLSCVPMNVVAEIGTGMLEGAAKYGRHNYRAIGVRASVYFDATMRHLISWWEGEDIDPDSGMNHVAKALTSLTVLRDAQLQGKCEDDRPPKSQPFYPQLNDQAAAILDRHADKNPHHYTQKEMQ